MNDNADIGIIGLGVMGRNFILNLNDHGFKVAVYNRTTGSTEAFIKGKAGAGFPGVRRGRAEGRR